MRRAFLFPHSVNSLTCVFRTLVKLSQGEDYLWCSFLALFRADPCLLRLEGLERDLRQEVQLMTVGCLVPTTEKYLTRTQENRHTSPGAFAPLDAHQNTVFLTADMPSPRGEENNAQTLEANATSRPAEFASHDPSCSNGTGIEFMGTGTGTGNLRQGTAGLDLPVSEPEESGTRPQRHTRNKSAPFSNLPPHDTFATILKPFNKQPLVKTRAHSM